MAAPPLSGAVQARRTLLPLATLALTVGVPGVPLGVAPAVP